MYVSAPVVEGAFTIEAFVNPTALSTTSDVTNTGTNAGNYIFAGTSNINGSGDYFVPRSNAYWAELYMGGTFASEVGSPDGGTVTSSAVQVGIGAWTHVAMTRDLSGNVTLYIGGKQTAVSATNSSASLTDATTFFVGPDFSGAIDDVRVWNVVRSGDQILGDSKEKVLPLPSENLVLYWRFDEGTTAAGTRDWSTTDGGAGYVGVFYSDVTSIPTDR